MRVVSWFRREGVLAGGIFVASLLCACLPEFQLPPGQDGGPGSGPIGSGPTGSGPTGNPPSAPDGGAPGGADAGTPQAPRVACIPPAASNASGQHNPGQACLGCHNFSLGGTLFSTLAGAAPVVGATIEVTDAAGQKISLVSAQNGNFWTGAAITWPATVRASACPDDKPMITKLSGPTMGDCNMGGCHTSTFRVHLP